MLIGITGKKRAGKDTVAKIISDKYNYQHFSFASPIKEACKVIFLWTDDFIENHKEEIDPRFGISPRQALQNLGDDWAQNLMPNKFRDFEFITGRSLWVKNCIERMKINGEDKNYVFSDVRYPHEINMIKEKGGFIIKVLRPDARYDDTHSSENSLNDTVAIDFAIYNQSTLYALERDVVMIMDNYINKRIIING